MNTKTFAISLFVILFNNTALMGQDACPNFDLINQDLTFAEELMTNLCASISVQGDAKNNFIEIVKSEIIIARELFGRKPVYTDQELECSYQWMRNLMFVVDGNGEWVFRCWQKYGEYVLHTAVVEGYLRFFERYLGYYKLDEELLNERHLVFDPWQDKKKMMSLLDYSEHYIMSYRKMIDYPIKKWPTSESAGEHCKIYEHILQAGGRYSENHSLERVEMFRKDYCSYAFINDSEF